TRAQDELVGRLVGPCLLAFGGFAPRGHRMAAAGGPAFTTAMRVVDRVHDDAAIMRALAPPHGAARLAVIDIAVVGVRHRANGRQAGAVHDALLARRKPQDRHALVATDQLGVGAGRTRNLSALARLQLDVVDDGADR